MGTVLGLLKGVTGKEGMYPVEVQGGQGAGGGPEGRLS